MEKDRELNLQENTEINNKIEEGVDNTSTQLIEKENTDLVTNLLNAKNVNELDDALALFQFNEAKKTILRTSKLSDLLDSINEQAEKRIEETPDLISNKDLMSFMNTVGSQLDNHQKILYNIKENPPNIKVENNTINLSVKNDDQYINLTNDSKRRIVDFIKDVLKDITKDNSNEKVSEDIIENDESEKTND